MEMIKYNLTLLMLLATILFSCEKHAQPSVYYIPENYKGAFAVVYSQTYGCPEKLINGRRQLYIPANGLLISQFDYSDGIRDDIFLQRKKNGFDTLRYFLDPKFGITNLKEHKSFTSDINKGSVLSAEQVFGGIFYDKNANTHRTYYYEIIQIDTPSKVNLQLKKTFVTYLDSLLENNQLSTVKINCKDVGFTTVLARP